MNLRYFYVLILAILAGFGMSQTAYKQGLADQKEKDTYCLEIRSEDVEAGR